MTRPLRAAVLPILLFLVVGYFGALTLMQLDPAQRPRGELIPIPTDWVATDPPSPRGYFRRHFTLPFVPRQAWIGIAADDYVVFINGRQVIRNAYILNAALGFQHKTAGYGQSVTNNESSIARTPDLRRSANQERAAVTFMDITRFLKAGDNVMAVHVKSITTASFVIFGEAYDGHGRAHSLSAEASQWRFSQTANSTAAAAWYLGSGNDPNWYPARSLGRHSETVFALVPARVWSEMLPRSGIVGHEIAGEINFVCTFPILRDEEIGTGVWLRTYSTWPYRVIIGDRLVTTSDQSENTTVTNIAPFLNGERALRVRLVRSTDVAPATPVLAFDLVTAGRRFGSYEDCRESLPAFQDPPPLATGASGPDTVVLEDVSRPIIVASLPADWSQTYRLLLLCIGSSTFAFLGWISLRRIFIWLRITASPAGCAYAAIVVLSMPMIMRELLRRRFLESDTILFFLDPRNNWVAVLPALSIGLMLCWVAATPMALRSQRLSQSTRPVMRNRSARLATVLLLLILCLAAYLRMYAIGFESLQADENVSFDAARGILRGGLPQAMSGVLYTRSPLYHYLLAGWLFIFGDHVVAARSFSVLPGVAVVAVAYHLTRALGGGRTVALLVALALAVDPWQINIARNIRFYQQMQFLFCLAALFFFKGFIARREPRSQYLFVLFITAAALSQEVAVITLPGFVVAAALFYRDFFLPREIKLISLSIAGLLVIIVDLAVFVVMCLTAHVGIATTSASIMQIHFLNITTFGAGFFLGELRSNYIWMMLFFLATIACLIRPKRQIAAALIIVWSTIAVATILVMQIATRYLFAIYPLFLIIGVTTLDDAISAGKRIFFPGNGRLDRALALQWGKVVTGVLLITMTANLELWRSLASYREPIVPQHELGYEFIAARKLPGDVVMSVSPMAAAIILHGLDYYLMEQLSFDEVYQSKRGIVDRWAGGVLVPTTDSVSNVLLSHDRVWVMLDEAEMPKLSDEMVKLILASTTQEMTFYGGEVRLWERTKGAFGAVASKSNGANW